MKKKVLVATSSMRKERKEVSSQNTEAWSKETITLAKPSEIKPNPSQGRSNYLSLEDLIKENFDNDHRSIDE